MQAIAIACCCGRGFSPDAFREKLSGLKPLPQGFCRVPVTLASARL